MCRYLSLRGHKVTTFHHENLCAFDFQHEFIYIILAPTKIEIVKVSTTIVVAKATSPADTTGIKYFEARVLGGLPTQKCAVMISAKPHQCEINGLIPNTDYTISMHSCLAGPSGCSSGVIKEIRTLPNRVLICRVKGD